MFGSTRFAFPGCEPKGQPRDMVPLITPTEVDALMKPWQDKNAPLEAAKKKQLTAAKSAGEAIAKLGGTSSKVLAESKIAEGASVPFEHRLRVRKGEVVQLAVSPNTSHGADTTLIEWRITETDGAKRSWSVAEMVPDLMKGNPHPAHDGAAWCFLEPGAAEGPAFLAQRKERVEGKPELVSWVRGELPSAFANTSPNPVKAWTDLPGHTFFVHPAQDRPVAVAWVCPADGRYLVNGVVADGHPAALDGVSFTLAKVAGVGYLAHDCKTKLHKHDNRLGASMR
jgi:hypothetical protein